MRWARRCGSRTAGSWRCPLGDVKANRATYARASSAGDRRFDRSICWGGALGRAGHARVDEPIVPASAPAHAGRRPALRGAKWPPICGRPRSGLRPTGRRRPSAIYSASAGGRRPIHRAENRGAASRRGESRAVSTKMKDGKVEPVKVPGSFVRIRGTYARCAPPSNGSRTSSSSIPTT